MITRDFILRQIHQLAQALAQVLLHKQAGRQDEVEEVLAGALQQVTGLELQQIRTLHRDELLRLCETDGEFSADKAVAMADLLREDLSPEGRERAIWLYEAALNAGGAVPLDVYERINELRSSLQ